jgi:hypothetical protein
LVPEDTILSGQILVTKEEFLVNGAGDVGEESLPVHRGKVNQPSGRGSTVRLPHNPLWAGPFERFDLTSSQDRKKNSAHKKFGNRVAGL